MRRVIHSLVDVLICCSMMQTDRARITGSCHQLIQLSVGSQRVWLIMLGEVCVTNSQQLHLFVTICWVKKEVANINIKLAIKMIFNLKLIKILICARISKISVDFWIMWNRKIQWVCIAFYMYIIFNITCHISLSMGKSIYLDTIF